MCELCHETVTAANLAGQHQAQPNSHGPGFMHRGHGAGRLVQGYPKATHDRHMSQHLYILYIYLV